MALCPPTTPTAVDQGGATTISAVHSDIIQSHIFTRLDGPTLAAAGCATSQLRALSTEEKLWRDICTATWHSINDPLVQTLISIFPAGHRSFFSDAFPLLDHRSFSSESNPDRSSFTTGLISAVDIYYKDKVVYSKAQESETVTDWFQCSPFRVDLIGPKDSVPAPILYSGDDEAWLNHLEENLTLSWILIDPARKRAVNLSARKPVSVQRHWLTGDIQVKYATVIAGDQRPGSSSEFVQCGIVVTCGGKEGEDMSVREVSMVVEDMEGRILNGSESLEILQAAMEKGKRKKMINGNEGKERYREYEELKKERREMKMRREQRLDMACIATGVSIFVAFWCFVLFR